MIGLSGFTRDALLGKIEGFGVEDEGLGHSGHVVAIDGAALVIDPLRSVDAYLAVIDRRGWRLAWTADTHTHADYVSKYRSAAASALSAGFLTQTDYNDAVAAARASSIP